MAQTDRVMIGAAPLPDQTQRLRMTQEMDFTLAPTGQPAGAATASTPDSSMTMRITGVTSILMRQQTGKPEPDGRLRVDITYEDMSQEMKMNGKPAPIPANATAGLIGKTISAWLDAKSQVLDVKVPEGFPMTADQFKTMFSQMMSAVPHQEMAVGDTVTTPLSMQLPLPIPGGAGAQLEGKTKTTLTKLTPADNDRLATLDQAIDAAMDMTPESPAGKLRIRFTMNGAGTTEFAVNSRQIRSSSMTTKLDGTIEPQKSEAGGATGGSTPPAMKMSGTMIQKVERVP